MKKLILGSTLIAASCAFGATASAGDVSVSTSIDYTTDYVFRGVSLAESAIQPGVEVAFGDAYVGAWVSTAIGDTSIFAGDELDLYAGYGLSLTDDLAMDVGVTYYHYPQGGSLFGTDGGAAGTYEVYAGLSYDTVLSPSLYGYYDLTLEAFTVEGGLGHSVEVSEKTSLDLGVTAGLVDGDGFSYEYGQLSASFGYAFTDDVSAYLGANYALSSEDTLIGDSSIDLTDILNPVVDLDLGGSKLFFGAGVAAGF